MTPPEPRPNGKRIRADICPFCDRTVLAPESIDRHIEKMHGSVAGKQAFLPALPPDPVTPPEPTDREALREAVDKAIDRTFDRWSAGVLPNELLRERTRRTIRAALELVELERLDRATPERLDVERAVRQLAALLAMTVPSESDGRYERQARRLIEIGVRPPTDAEAAEAAERIRAALASPGEDEHEGRCSPEDPCNRCLDINENAVIAALASSGESDV